MQVCNYVFELIIRLNIEIFLKKMCLNLIMESNVLNLRNCSVFKFYPIITTTFHNFNLDASYIYIKSSLFFFCMVNLEMYWFFFFFFFFEKVEMYWLIANNIGKAKRNIVGNLTLWWWTELLTIDFVHVPQNCFQITLSRKLLEMEWIRTFKEQLNNAKFLLSTAQSHEHINRCHICFLSYYGIN